MTCRALIPPAPVRRPAETSTWPTAPTSRLGRWCRHLGRSKRPPARPRRGPDVRRSLASASPGLRDGAGPENSGAVHLLQNCWGKEKQFITVLPDAVREFSPQFRVELEENTNGEHPALSALRSGAGMALRGPRCGDRRRTRPVLHRGRQVRPDAPSPTPDWTPADCAFDDSRIYVADFATGCSTSSTRTDSIPLGHRRGRTTAPLGCCRRPAPGAESRRPFALPG